MTLDGSLQRNTAAGTYTKTSGTRRSYAVLFCKPTRRLLLYCTLPLLSLFSEGVSLRGASSSTARHSTRQSNSYTKVCSQIKDTTQTASTPSEAGASQHRNGGVILTTLSCRIACALEEPRAWSQSTARRSPGSRYQKRPPTCFQASREVRPRAAAASCSSAPFAE